MSQGGAVAIETVALVLSAAEKNTYDYCFGGLWQLGIAFVYLSAGV